METAERRTVEDLDRALRSLATHFKEDAFVVIGSQAALVGWPSTPDGMRITPEIDIYLARMAWWNRQHPDIQADDEIDGLFGRASAFHARYGFYIDGVSPNTAPLPKGWQDRAVFREVAHGDIVITAVAPCIEDLIVSKLRRLDPKDERYVEACIASRGLDLELVKEGIASAPYNEHERQRALSYVDTLTSKKPMRFDPVTAPDFPQDGSHKAIWAKDGLHVFIREFDERSGHYLKPGNPLGPAFRSNSAEAYFVHGRKMSKAQWEQHPDVIGYGQTVRRSTP